MSPTLWISSAGDDPASPNQGPRVRRVGPVGRILIALTALALIALGLLVAIPLLLIGSVAVFILLLITRVRRSIRLRTETTAGRKNVRVIRRDNHSSSR